MQKKYIYILIAIILASATGAYFYFFTKKQKKETREITINQETMDYINSKKDLIVISSPEPEETISSPLKVFGKARGTWFFEASFPIIVVDWDGKIISQSYATAQDEWMTENFVPFEGTLTFNNPSFEADFSKRGSIIFKKDNPSGLPEHDDALEIPVFFE